MKKLLLLSTTLALLCFSCDEEKKESDVEKTPIASEDLDDLDPDMTINDLVTILEAIDRNPGYNSLVKLAGQAQMIDDIKNLNDVTFFAPTNAAINKLSDEEYANLRLPQNLSRLQDILNYHIVKGERDAETLIMDIKNNDGKPYRLQTIQGGFIALTLNEGTLIVTDEGGSTAEVTQPNMETSDGVIHGVASLLVPN